MRNRNRYSPTRLALGLLSLPCLLACSSEAGGDDGANAGGAAGSTSATGGYTSATGGAAPITGGSASATGGASTTTASAGATSSSGGSSATGGTTAASGGSSSSGGSSATGGTTAASSGSSSSGGSSATGGTTAASGGSSATGGTTAASGGSSATGGTTAASGGSSATGGTTATSGGSSATGGTTAASGGSSATGGTTATTGGTSSTKSDLWVSPAGKDSNPGTQAEPLLTLSKAVTLATPGITIWMMAGTHSYSATVSIQSSSVKSGTANTVDGTEAAPINVWAVAGVRPVLDFAGEPRSSEDEATAGRGIALWAHYWHLKGLEIINAADNGIHIAGSHNVIENCVIHNNHDAGLQITVPSALESDNTLGAHNKIINCDSYDNWDSYSWNLGENADGFAAKLRIGPGNSFTGCRAWRNADDGWDLYGADDPVTITNSWAFNNKPSSSAAMAEGDGNGFKLGGDDVRAAHVASGLFAFDNAKDGFTANSNPATLTCSGCGAWNNAGKATTDVTITSAISRSTSSAKAEAAVRNADGSLPDLP